MDSMLIVRRLVCVCMCMCRCVITIMVGDDYNDDVNSQTSNFFLWKLTFEERKKNFFLHQVTRFSLLSVHFFFSIQCRRNIRPYSKQWKKSGFKHIHILELKSKKKIYRFKISDPESTI